MVELSVPGRPRELVSIQYLRGAAAIMVVTWHALSQVGLPEWAFLQSGVDIFFVISGFVMWTVTRDRPIAPGAFLRRRLIRVVPLYWALTTLVLLAIAVAPGVLQSLRTTPAHALASYLFVPWTNPVEGVGLRPVIVPGWTLNYEIAFYLMFAASLALPLRTRAVAILGALAALSAIPLVTGPLRGVAGFYTAPFMAEIGLGVLAAILVERAAGSAAKPLLLAAALSVAPLALCGSAAEQSDLVRFLAFGLPGLLIVSAAALWEKTHGVAHVRLAKLLGDATYATYLAHPFALSAAVRLWRAAGGDALPAAVFIIAAIVLSCIVGIGVHLLLEKPLTAMLQARLGEPRKRHAMFAPANEQG